VLGDDALAELLSRGSGWPLLPAPACADMTSALDALAQMASPPEACVCTTSPDLVRYVHAQRLFNEAKLSLAEWEAVKEWHACIGWTPDLLVVAPVAADFLVQTALLKWTRSKVLSSTDPEEVLRVLLEMQEGRC